MANVNCESCESLRQTAPELIVNGFTDDMCTSLQNDTGLIASSGNDDCTDLNNLNDCLVGNMETEVDAYDVCDWKTFMKKFIPNVWTTLKGIICAICGLWTNLKTLQEQNDSMCTLIDALISPPASRFGTLLNDEGDAHPTHRGGTIGVKSNQPVVVPMAQSELSTPVWNAQNIGIYLGKQQVSRCSDGRCQNYEWIAPSTIGYKINDNMDLTVGDIIWYATKAECMAWGMSEDMWEAFTISSWTWFDYGLGSGSKRANIWIRLHVNNNRLEMTYQGYVGDDQTNAGRQILEGTEPLKRYIYNCN